MIGKRLQIIIPENETIPEIIQTFSPEENLLMIKIGSECLLEGRKYIVGFSQKEIYNKIKEESLEQVKQLEEAIIVEKKCYENMEIWLKKCYDGQIHKLEEANQMLKEQITNYEKGNYLLIEKQIKVEREKFDLLLQEKDRQNQLNREAFDKITKLTNKSTSLKGTDGEKTFSQIADTFKDFKGF
jgi:hypothetical protein